MRRLLPRCVGNGLNLYATGGIAAVREYFNQRMSTEQKQAVDFWLLGQNHPLVRTPGTQLWRFQLLVTELHGEQKRKHLYI